MDSYEGASAAGIDAVLSMVKVEKIEKPVVDASGAVTDATVVRELSTSEYQYLVEHNIKEETPSKRSDLYQFTTSDNKKWTTNQPYVSTSPEFPKGHCYHSPKRRTESFVKQRYYGIRQMR